MKLAHHPDTHQSITAVADTPPQALCRHRMDDTAVSFWRHLDNQSQTCTSRTHAAQLKSTATASPKKKKKARRLSA